ncbi:MAG: trypsin-like peptidase domain-containing protein [Pirellulales bacterium]
MNRSHFVRPTRAACAALFVAALLVATLTNFAVLPNRADAMDLVELVKRVENAVVRVDTDSSLGSGVIVDNRGYVLTNYHVIEGARTASVTLRSGEEKPVRGYLALEPTRDLAVLKIDALPMPHAVNLAGVLPQIGEKVAAFGNPRGFSFTTTEGIVSAIRSGTEVSEIIGADMYRELGYSTAATWVQTSSPISPGNSGGPLVNMNAEVVGLNTWGDPKGQNINFAISATDMRRILNRALDAPVHELEKMPKRRVPTGGRSGRDDEFALTMPSGRVFSFAIFEEDEITALMSAAKTETFVIVTHPSGVVYAAAAQAKGVLNGVTIAQHENKEVMAQINYVDGKRHGVAKTWNRAGEPDFFAQYGKGKRHGFLCLFKGGSPSLVIDYEYDQPKYVQLVAGGKAQAGFESLAEAEKDGTAHELLARLEAADDALVQHEVRFRKQVSTFEQEKRKALARELAPQKRARMRDRAMQRDAQDQAFLQELFRRAHGR